MNRTESADTLRRERWKLLVNVHRLLERPMAVLSVCWLALLVIDFTVGLNRELLIVNWTIWSLFAIDAAIEFTLAPSKLIFVRRRWITLVAVILPAFRIVRFVRFTRVVRVARSVKLVRLLTSLNRNLSAIRTYFGSRGLATVIALTAAVVFAGAAGMFQFENAAALQQAGIAGSHGLRSYPEALWWTAMIITTMGSDYWPKTAEGRVLCFILSVYAFAVFGYITASIASFLVGRRSVGV